jgi:hypothetical protein
MTLNFLKIRAQIGASVLAVLGLASVAELSFAAQTGLNAVTHPAAQTGLNSAVKPAAQTGLNSAVKPAAQTGLNGAARTSAAQQEQCSRESALFSGVSC